MSKTKTFNLTPLARVMMTLAFVMAPIVITGCGGSASTAPSEKITTEDIDTTPTTKIWSESADTLMTRISPDLISREEWLSSLSSLTLSAEAEGFLTGQSADGSWPDINFSLSTSASWGAAEHLDRVLTIAAAYHQSPSESLKTGVLNGLVYWYTINPHTSLWWWRDIGKQQRLGPIGILMHKVLSDELIAKIVEDMPIEPSMSGANGSDISQAVIYGGLLDDSNSQISAGFQGFKETIVITTEEGIQKDFSFHQHGPQLHNGSYGAVWRNTVFYWAYQVRDLEWSFSEEKTDILSAYYLDGDRWMTHGRNFNYSVLGRAISRPGSSKSDGYDKNIDYVAALTPSRADEAEAFKQHMLGGVSGLNGFKHFWRSDFSVNMRDDYLFSIHMNSDRVVPTESGNGENLLGYWLGFGTTYLMQSGEEYKDIFPIWDWKYIPGVTSPAVEDKATEWGEITNVSSFVGGVTDGKYGVSVFEMKDVKETQAKKSWFSFDNEIVALGAGISSSNSAAVNTTLNQVLMNGVVTVDGIVIEKGDSSLVDAQWVHHDNVGYIFPSGWDGQLSNKEQTGDWNRINTTVASDEVKKDVFLLRIKHGQQPDNASYEYIMAPGKTAEQTQQYASALPVTVIENSTLVQAVLHEQLQVTGVVFYVAGAVQVRPGLTIKVDQPSVLLLDESQVPTVVSVSTPGSLGGKVNVTLNYADGGEITQAIAMPSLIDEMGKSVTVVFDGVTVSD